VNYCPTSAAYREGSAAIAGAIAERYRELPGLRLWHVNNEYGPTCFCEGCREEFLRWLRDRYQSLAALNDAWGSAFWGNQVQDWNEVEFPSRLNSMADSQPGSVRFSPSPGTVVDHNRFVSATLLKCFLNEKRVLREITPDVPITTNFHGITQSVDWHEWGPHVDLVSWDSYPPAGSHWTFPSFAFDMARSVKGRDEFLLMELPPGSVNWHSVSSLRPPGITRLEALQAVARGSRGALFFQVRQSRAGNELNHSGLIPRHGRLDTRMGKELVRLGRDLGRIGVPPDVNRLPAKAGLVFSWGSWWAHHATPGLDQRSRYMSTARAFHRALAEHNVVTDVIGPDAALGDYEIVVAPLLYVVTAEQAESLHRYVAGGGTLVTTALSGIALPDARVHLGGAEPTWQRLVGLWVEETDARAPEFANRVLFDDGTTAPAREIFDVVRLEGAKPIARFEDAFYRGSPAVTVNEVGAGRVYYLASLTPELFSGVLDRLLSAVGAWESPAGVEIVPWRSDHEDLVFVLNHGEATASVTPPPGNWTDLLTGHDFTDAIDVEATDLVVARRAR
jgi:beta-galactosidase